MEKRTTKEIIKIRVIIILTRICAILLYLPLNLWFLGRGRLSFSGIEMIILSALLAREINKLADEIIRSPFKGILPDLDEGIMEQPATKEISKDAA